VLPYIMHYLQNYLLGPINVTLLLED